MLNLRLGWVYTGVCALSLLLAGLPVQAKGPPHSALVARGRYLAVVGGCNDCHTAGYADSGGRVPERNWLAGSALGWHGPWGTTYPPNLRLFMQTMPLKRWIHFARTARLRPPMPYWSLRTMSVRDLTSLYAFVRSLGPMGDAAPAYLPPGKTPRRPYVTWVLPSTPRAAARPDAPNPRH